MMTNFSLLHISDLHRTRTHISNSVIINSMEYILDEYVKERQPQILVVSGDLIQGSKATTEAEVIEELDRQYEETESLLTELTRLYFDGDKRRVIIIPGNHDVSFFHSKQSMTLDTMDGDRTRIMEHKKSLYSLMTRSLGSRIRWSWGDLEFFHITDNAMYNRRLEAYCRFYERFYEGARTYSLEPEKQFDFFEFDDLNTVIVGFNSCHENDHCNFSGAIHVEAISEVERKLKDPRYHGRLRIAVWHHHTSGNPNRSFPSPIERISNHQTSNK